MVVEHSRRNFIAISAGASLAVAAATDEPEIRLIVQGDDMGAAHAVNTGTIGAYREGIVRTTNVIVPGPWLLEAVKLLNENPALDVGIHLALTSEWSLVKWRPLTNARTLADTNGFFPPMVFRNDRFPAGSSLIEMKPKTDEVEKELRAQIEMGRRLMPRVTYVSTHMVFDQAFPEWRALVKGLAAEYKLRLVGDDPEIRWLDNVWTATDSGEVRSEKLARRLDTLEAGTWRMVDHAAVDDPEMRAIYHPGYENVAADRNAVRQAWCSARVLEVVRKRNIQLTGYRGLRARGAM